MQTFLQPRIIKQPTDRILSLNSIREPLFSKSESGQVDPCVENPGIIQTTLARVITTTPVTEDSGKLLFSRLAEEIAKGRYTRNRLSTPLRVGSPSR